ILPADQVDEMISRSDILILAAPLTEVTRGMIDARRLSLMPEQSTLINVARGPLVVEDDLVEALVSGHLWGAGIDVTEVEPMPEDSSLWTVDKLIITPHVGGQRASRIDDMTRLFCENIARFRSGEPLINLVDKKLGFPAPGASFDPR
ncbi:MAG: NAD(P)-dependent oxidoreductase, partial [Lacipirellulaceae bacterium]